MQVEEQETLLMSKEEILDKITTYTGGRVAEELIFGSVTSGASNDIEQATKLARAMITRLGMSDNFGMMALETVGNQYLGGDASLACSEQTAAKIDEEVRQVIAQCYDKAKQILSGKYAQAARAGRIPAGEGNHHRRRIYEHPPRIKSKVFVHLFQKAADSKGRAFRRSPQ